MKKIVFLFTLLFVTNLIFAQKDTFVSFNPLKVKMGMEYRYNNFNNNYSTNPVLTLGLEARLLGKISHWKYIPPDSTFFHGIFCGIDYGIGKSNLECDVYSASAQLMYGTTGVGSATSVAVRQLMIGTKYQYDNILTQTKSLHNHSLGAFLRYSHFQWNLEVGYLWGLNKLEMESKMNTFFLKLSVSIPTFGFSYRANMNKTFNAATL